MRPPSERPRPAYRLSEDLSFRIVKTPPAGIAVQDGTDPPRVRLNVPRLGLARWQARVEVAFEQALAQVQDRQSDPAVFPVDERHLTIAADHRVARPGVA